jgi:hypothetical protein
LLERLLNAIAPVFFLLTQPRWEAFGSGRAALTSTPGGILRVFNVILDWLILIPLKNRIT